MFIDRCDCSAEQEDGELEIPDCLEPSSGHLAVEVAAELEPELQDGMNHPVRREILRRLNESPEGCSLFQLSPQLASVDVSRVHYHLQVLAGLRVVVPDESSPLEGRPVYRSIAIEDPKAIAVLRATEGWDRAQQVTVKGVASWGRAGE